MRVTHTWHVLGVEGVRASILACRAEQRGTVSSGGWDSVCWQSCATLPAPVGWGQESVSDLQQAAWIYAVACILASFVKLLASHARVKDKSVLPRSCWPWSFRWCHEQRGSVHHAGMQHGSFGLFALPALTRCRNAFCFLGVNNL